MHIAVGPGKLFFNPLGDDIQIDQRLSNGYASLYAANRSPLMRSARADLFLAHIERNPKVGAARQRVPRGHDPDNVVSLGVQFDAFSNGSWLPPKALLPETVAQQSHMTSIVLVFPPGECPPNLRLHAQQ